MKPLHELDALCAEKVAGCVPCDNWKPLMHDSQMHIDDSCGHANCIPRSMWPPKYSENPAAVLALLEKEGYRCTGNRCGGTAATIVQVTNAHPEKGGPKYFEGRADDSMISADNTFALAATLALLKAHGVETE